MWESGQQGITSGTLGGEPTTDVTSPAVALRHDLDRVRWWLRLLAVVFLGYAVAVMVYAANKADTGFSVLFGGPVLAVDKGSPAAEAGLREGDLILSVNGVSTATAPERFRALRDLEPGARLALVVARGPSTHALSFDTTAQFPWGSLAGAALAAMLLGLALLADRGGPGSEPRVFYRSTLVYVIFLAGTFSWETTIMSPVLAVPWFFAMNLAAPMTCRFMLYFPAGEPKLALWQRALLFGPPLLLASVHAAAMLAFHAGVLVEGSQIFGVHAGVLVIAMAAAYLVFGSAARQRRLRQKRDEVDPAAARWLRIGHVAMAVPLLAGSVWAALDVRFFITGAFRPFIAATMMGGAVTVVLAMTRTRFGELDRVLRRGSGHLIATVLAAALYLGLIGVLGGVAASSSGGSFTAALTATLFAAVVFGPMRARLQRFVDEKFARQRSRARHLLMEASEFASRTLDVEVLCQGVVQRVKEAFRADGAALYVANDPSEGGWRVEASEGFMGIGEKLGRRDPIGSRIELALAFGMVREVASDVVAAPIPSQTGPGSALLVATFGGRVLDEEECELLQTLALGLAVAMANARAHTELKELSEKLQHEVEIAEKRRKEIARLKDRLEEEKRLIEVELQRRGGRAPVIGLGLRPTYELAQKVARSDVNVLVQGETGVGKELVARAIHAGSNRTDGAFVVVDCGAIPKNLFESHLFGHEKGAFTGATRATPGAFRAAHGGTIFLDEIGELPLDLQPKLLRVLQEREVRPVGSEKTFPVDVRVVAGTNRELGAEVEAGRFREDLLYRLRVVEIVVPPLRARKRDIPELAESFLDALAERRGQPPKRLAPEALKLLLDYDWPGNVRELEHAIEAAAITCDGDWITPGDLPIHDEMFRRKGQEALARSRADTGPGIRETLNDLEREQLLQALRENDGNRTRTARALGLSRGALLRRMRRYGIS